MNQGEIFEKILGKGEVDNIFLILAIKKNVTFNLKDIDNYGMEMLDQLYAGELFGD